MFLGLRQDVGLNKRKKANKTNVCPRVNKKNISTFTYDPPKIEILFLMVVLKHLKRKTSLVLQEQSKTKQNEHCY